MVLAPSVGAVEASGRLPGQDNRVIHSDSNHCDGVHAVCPILRTEGEKTRYFQKGNCVRLELTPGSAA